MRTVFALAAATALFFAPTTAEACSCILPDLKQSWHEGSDILGVKVLAERTVGYERQYLVKLRQTFSGCLPENQKIVITTPFDGAACGAYLSVGEKYILATGNNGNTVDGYPAVSLSSCSWQSLYSAVSADDLDFLWTRPNECGGVLTCADDSAPISCLVDPCTTAAACPDGTCEDNYCGGCWAEFYDNSGYPVCEPW